MSSKEEYEDVLDEEPFLLGKNELLRLACCDCGLVHDINIENHQRFYRITMTRNDDETEARRSFLAQERNEPDQ